MEKYEQLKKVIQQANPEIMELKFGCQVEYQGDIWNVAKLTVKAILLAHVDGIKVTRFGDYEDAVEKYGVKILGRPIRLADVLLAIEKHGLNHQIEYHNILFDLLVRNESLWNLHDDNLDHQSDETKQFLIDLIV